MNITYLLGNNLLVETPILLESDLLSIVDRVLLLAQGRLAAFANSPQFSQKMAVAFGEGAETAALQADWLGKDYSILSGIEIRQGTELNGANGAYGATTNRIYLSEDFLRENLGNLEALVSVVLEEAGHRIDARLNTVDSAGDEGAIFSALVRGESLDAETLQALKAEDDRAIIVLDGQVIQVEDSDNSLGTAINVGTLSSTQTFTDFVGSTDTLDYYKFSLTETSDVTLMMSGVTQNYLYSKIYYDKNNNGVIDSGDEINSEVVFANSNKEIKTTLGAGSYYVGVSGSPPLSVENPHVADSFLKILC